MEKPSRDSPPDGTNLHIAPVPAAGRSRLWSRGPGSRPVSMAPRHRPAQTLLSASPGEAAPVPACRPSYVSVCPFAFTSRNPAACFLLLGVSPFRARYSQQPLLWIVWARTRSFAAPVSFSKTPFSQSAASTCPILPDLILLFSCLPINFVYPTKHYFKQFLLSADQEGDALPLSSTAVTDVNKLPMHSYCIMWKTKKHVKQTQTNCNTRSCRTDKHILPSRHLIIKNCTHQLNCFTPYRWDRGMAAGLKHVFPLVTLHYVLIWKSWGKLPVIFCHSSVFLDHTKQLLPSRNSNAAPKWYLKYNNLEKIEHYQ